MKTSSGVGGGSVIPTAATLDAGRHRRLVENFILLASRNRASVQQALAVFLEMCGPPAPPQQQPPTSAEASSTGGSGVADAVVSVGAILGSARAFMLLKQTPKAKLQLKRVRTFYRIYSPLFLSISISTSTAR